MSILQIITDEPGQINTPNVRRVKIVSSDNLATVTTAGYLNPSVLQGFTIYNTDIIDMWYGATGNVNGITNPGTYAEFLPTIANGIITLALQVNPGDVLLPVISGHFASFNGTSGQIKDSGVSPSNPSKSKVASINNTTIINHIATYTDSMGTIGEDVSPAINGGSLQAGLSGTAGSLISYPATAANGFLQLSASNNSANTSTTITNAATIGQNTNYVLLDPGVASTNFVLSNGFNQMGAGSSIALAKATGTESGGAVTINAQSGVLTTSSLTTSPGTRYQITFTNSAITSTSVILLTWMGGTNTVTNIQFSIVPSAGSALLNIYNSNTIDPLTGTVILGFSVF